MPPAGPMLMTFMYYPSSYSGTFVCSHLYLNHEKLRVAGVCGERSAGNRIGKCGQSRARGRRKATFTQVCCWLRVLLCLRPQPCSPGFCSLCPTAAQSFHFPCTSAHGLDASISPGDGAWTEAFKRWSGVAEVTGWTLGQSLA